MISRLPLFGNAPTAAPANTANDTNKAQPALTTPPDTIDIKKQPSQAQKDAAKKAEQDAEKAAQEALRDAGGTVVAKL